MYSEVLEKIQTIELNTRKKLLEFIDKKIEENPNLETLDFYYPDFDFQKNKLAFQLWLSMDYMNENGKNLIEEFLMENLGFLEVDEVELLNARSISTVSLYEILSIDDESSETEILDLMRNKVFKIYDLEISDMLNEEDIIFGRLGKIFDLHTFIGDIHYLPNFTKSVFMKQFMVNYNSTIKVSPNLTVDEYLKKYSLNMYTFYTNCVFEAMDLDEDITSVLYDELDQFEAYLSLNTSDYVIKKHIANLIDFFEFYLADDNLTLCNLDEINMKDFFEDSIADGFISSQEDLNSYISTFRSYSHFLSKINSKYETLSLSMVEISHSRFLIMDKFKEIEGPFKIDRKVSNYLNNISFKEENLISNFDKFLLYVLDKPLELDDNRDLKLEDLIQLDMIVNQSTNLLEKSFPALNLYVNLGKKLELLKIKDNNLMTSKKSSYYFRLKEEEKYSLFLDYVFSNEFMNLIYEDLESMDFNIVDKIYNILNTILVNESIIYNEELEKLFSNVYPYLETMGILNMKKYPTAKLYLTEFGKELLREIIFNNKDDKSSVVKLTDFRTIK